MEGWEKTHMSQRDGWFLKKINANIGHLKKVLRPQDSLLDVGCCEGYMSRELAHPNYQGIDLLESNVQRARELFPGVDFRQGNLFDLEGKWDVILCSRVLSHIPNYREAIERMKSCARRYLVIIVRVGDECSLREEIDRNGRRYFKTYTEEMLRFGKCDIYRTDRDSTVIYEC